MSRRGSVRGQEILRRASFQKARTVSFKPQQLHTVEEPRHEALGLSEFVPAETKNKRQSTSSQPVKKEKSTSIYDKGIPRFQCCYDVFRRGERDARVELIERANEDALSLFARLMRRRQGCSILPRSLRMWLALRCVLGAAGSVVIVYAILLCAYTGGQRRCKRGCAQLSTYICRYPSAVTHTRACVDPQPPARVLWCYIDLSAACSV
eukprot:7366445-Pyramimonas_sp.AAC.1